MKKIIFGIVGVLVLGGIGYFLLSSSSKVSQEYIDKYNEAAGISTEVIAALDNQLATLDKIDQLEKTQDFKGMEQILTEALSQNSSIAGKMELHKQRISELRTMSSKISDTEVKTKALALIGLIEEEDIHMAKAFDYQKQILEILNTYSKDVAAGKNPTISVDTLMSQTDAENKIVSDIADKINPVRDEFFKVAELEVAKDEK